MNVNNTTFITEWNRSRHLQFSKLDMKDIYTLPLFPHQDFNLAIDIIQNSHTATWNYAGLFRVVLNANSLHKYTWYLLHKLTYVIFLKRLLIKWCFKQVAGLSAHSECIESEFRFVWSFLCVLMLLQTFFSVLQFLYFKLFLVATFVYI